MKGNVNSASTASRAVDGETGGRGSIHSSVRLTSTSTTSRGAQRSLRSGRGPGSMAKNDVRRRMMEQKMEADSAVQVLDNGVNRTPMTLQQGSSVLGVRAANHGNAHGDRRESAASELGSSVFHSSYLLSSENHGGASKAGGAAAGGGLSSYLQSSTSSRYAAGEGLPSDGAVGMSSMEESMRSLSVAGESVSHGHLARGSERSTSLPTGGGGHAPGMGVLDHAALLHGAAYTAPTQLSEADRRQWMKAKTTLCLSETPTIQLYSHQDEVISSENAALEDDVRERNEFYVELAEAHRVDEGTRFQERAVATLAVAKKSIHCEVHPPAMVDAGALQVTPWMIKDAFAPLLGQDHDADHDADEDAKTAGEAGATNEDGQGQEPTADGTDGQDELEGSEAAGDEDGSVAGDSASGGDASTRRSTIGGAGGGRGRTGGSGVAAWMMADSLLSNLRVMERAVVQNMMERTQLAYRGIQMDDEAGRIGGSQPPAVQETREDDARVTPALPLGSASASAVSQSSASGGGEARAPSPQRDLQAMELSSEVRALWRYHSAQTRGRSVTCMAWNRKETDILAVGYSPRRRTHDTGGDGPLSDGAAATGAAAAEDESEDSASYLNGMICCWSLKNPLAPELVLHLQADCGVSALAFSPEHPNLLAVGNAAGGIVVYDIQKDTLFPSITPAVTAGLHTGAVWDLKWVPTGKDQGELLMSISADGRVVQWIVGKTVEKLAPDLIHLKRQAAAQVEATFVQGVAAAEEAAAAAAAVRRGRGHTRATAAATSGGAGADGARAPGKEEAVLSRQAGGMCFDVCPSDHAVYVVGTEEGGVYQCSKSQTESFDLEYVPHADLVYRVRWSPYSAKYFLTCSADWTARLYCVGRAAPVVAFESPSQDAVQDAAWSHTNALHFGVVTAQGTVDVWSVGESIYPVANVRYMDHRRLNCLLFAAQETPVMVVGDDEGDVTVFVLQGVTHARGELTDDEQEDWLEEEVKKYFT